jgi:hypothetical protein
MPQQEQAYFGAPLISDDPVSVRKPLFDIGRVVLDIGRVVLAPKTWDDRDDAVVEKPTASDASAE